MTKTHLYVVACHKHHARLVFFLLCSQIPNPLLLVTVSVLTFTKNRTGLTSHLHCFPLVPYGCFTYYKLIGYTIIERGYTCRSFHSESHRAMCVYTVQLCLVQSYVLCVSLICNVWHSSKSSKSKTLQFGQPVSCKFIVNSLDMVHFLNDLIWQITWSVN